MANYLNCQYPNHNLVKDILEKPGDEVPPILNGYRPDVWAYKKQKSSCVICEAKTSKDLDNDHTYNQLRSFAQYLEQKEYGVLILGTSGERADRAKTLLRFLLKELSLKSTMLKVFDGCDYWTLDLIEGTQWLLD